MVDWFHAIHVRVCVRVCVCVCVCVCVVSIESDPGLPESFEVAARTRRGVKRRVMKRVRLSFWHRCLHPKQTERRRHRHAYTRPISFSQTSPSSSPCDCCRTSHLKPFSQVWPPHLLDINERDRETERQRDRERQRETEREGGGETHTHTHIHARTHMHTHTRTCLSMIQSWKTIFSLALRNSSTSLIATRCGDVSVHSMCLHALVQYTCTCVQAHAHTHTHTICAFLSPLARVTCAGSQAARHTRSHGYDTS